MKPTAAKRDAADPEHASAALQGVLAKVRAAR